MLAQVRNRRWLIALSLGISCAAGAIVVRSSLHATARAQTISPTQVAGVLKAHAGVTVTPLDSALPGVVSNVIAEQTALAREKRGSVAVAATLATVQDSQGHHCVCWVIFVDPAGGLPAAGPSANPTNYDIVIIDGPTGFAYDRYYGYDPSLPTLLPIPAG